MGPPPLRLERVRLDRNGTTILDDVSLRVEHGERWLMLGANGSGKTSLLRIAALYDHPTGGVVEVLGQRLGQTDVRVLRRRVGYVSAALADQLRPGLRAHDVVRTARFAALEPWWHRYDDDDDRRARWCLEQLGVGSFGERALGSLSSGERQRVLLARSLMNEPAIVLLDEPSARLDLGGREQLVAALDAMPADGPPLVLATHHIDDVPPTTTHALLLGGGMTIATGPIETAMTSETLSECFGVTLQLERRRDGRYSAWATR